MSPNATFLARAVEHSLETLRKTAPYSLEATMAFIANTDGTELPPDALRQIVAHLRTCGPNDRILHVLTIALQSWDHQTAAPWAKGTLPHSEPRRRVILELLAFQQSDQAIINERVLRFSESDLPIIVAEHHEPWYAERKTDVRDFYWDHYSNQLVPPTGTWSTHSVGVLAASTEDVIARLSDPTRREIYPVKGLVMGYVQSGKTSHFSGLITKAADAGYRLIIVLAGTLDILRRQTQRRIDKEIVGKEILGTDEYGSDADWDAFVSHGGRPNHVGAFDWERLTNREDDYHTLRRHLSLLEFAATDRTKPFNHPENLRSAPAKLAVLKKVPARINQLCDDLEDLKELRSALEHVPTLVIDDESDQASINTIDQRKPGKAGQRRSTNKAIGRLLSLLPRAQYVGYTATPFANVFIDPNDAEDLFPKDFIVSLPRPAGYMGVSDFFDLEDAFDKGDFRGNKNAFVRFVEGEDDSRENLPKAIDSFIISGAIKLYRENQDRQRYRFRHHTMLIHHSATRVVHDADRELVEKVFAHGARYQRQEGFGGLRALFTSDFLPVSKVRALDEPFPPSFEELLPFITTCITKICAGKSVRVVNGEDKNRDDTPDFDQVPVWAILIGGAKLSRGYTVEGLTVSYYRRPTGAGDTLMQMGRWFGFRPGYRDLVRLFIGHKEKKGKVVVNLYEAFEAVCRDEEALRADLSKYSVEGILPRQVPPLVRQHLPSLPPTLRNMFNAQILSTDFAGDWTEKTSAPIKREHMSANMNAANKLLGVSALSPAERISFVNAAGKIRNFETVSGYCSGSEVLAFLRQYVWADGKKSVSLEMKYIASALESGKLGKWLVFLPQVRSNRRHEVESGKVHKLSVIERARVSESRFGVYSEPRHREAAAYLAGRLVLAKANAPLVAKGNQELPVLVLYFVEEVGKTKGELSVGFGIQYPGEKKETATVWGVRDPTQLAAVVVRKR